MRFVDRTFVLWAALGLLAPFLLGFAIGGTLAAGLTGLLWGGAVRIFLLHHVTYSINSLCHFFGSRRFPTEDESRNLLWLTPLSFGEAWHNNHHAFPTSARAWAASLGAVARPLGAADRRARACRPGLGRGSDQSPAPAAQGAASAT